MCIKVLDRFNRPIIIGARILDRKGRPDSFDAFNHRYPLLSRGWVLQERLMSSRLLECTYGEFAFSCLENQQCECESSLAPHGNSSQLALAIQPSFRRLLHAPGNAHRNKLSETWNTIISRYMQHELTETQDVLPAVAGIAEAMSIALNSYQYVAGMWKETLAEDLLWYVMQRRRTRHPQARPADSTAPSWSWASVSMGQAIAHMRIHPDRSLSENKLLLRKDTVKDICAAPLVQEVPFGKMSSNARLRIKSTLYPWYLRWYCKASERGSSTTKGKGRRGGRSKADLHILSKSSAAVCQAETAPLPIRGKNVEVLFDDVASLSSTKPGIDREPFVKCDARPPIRCSLGRIYLLPALHQRSDSWNLNVFLILQKMSSSYGDASCYARMGLFRLVSEDSSWEEITRGLANPQREEFWVL
jgi:hypothetical protein